MKKKLLALSLSLVIATPSIAATSLIPQFILKKHHQAKNLVKNRAPLSDEYVDFSGHWVGSCDNDPDEEEVLTIELASDFSSIIIDNTNYPIDAISTQSSHGNDEQEHSINHIRWSSDGQELLFTLSSHFKNGYLTQEGLESIVGNAQLLMNNEQLISNYELTIFSDGVLGDTFKIHCVYKNQK